MKSQLKDERGAVLIIELVVLAVVLVAAGFAAYHYLQHRKSANHASKPVPHIASKDTPSPGSAGAVLDIKELGVEIPLNNGPSNLRYQIENVPGLGTVSALDTNQLDQASSCSPGRLGLIVKAEGTIPSGLKPSYTTDESGAQLNYLLKQFNGFYVRHVAPQNACSLPGGAIYPDKKTTLETIRAVNDLQLMPAQTPTPATSISPADLSAITAVVKANVAARSGAPDKGSEIILRQFQPGLAHVDVNPSHGSGFAELLKKVQGQWTVAWSGQNISPDQEVSLGFPAGFSNSKPELSTLLYTY